MLSSCRGETCAYYITPGGRYPVLSVLVCPITGSPECPWCYETVRGRASHRGHAGFRRPRSPQSSIMADFLRKRETRDPSAPLPATSSQLATAMPALWAHLSYGSYPDGSPRERSTLSIFCGDYGLQACLNDRDNGLVAFVTADALEGLLEALERGLASDSVDWRKARSGPSARKGRK